MPSKKNPQNTTKLDRPLTVRDFLDGLGKFYEGKIEPKFDSINKRLDGHDRKFILIGEKLDSIENKLVEHDKKFDDIYNHIDGLYKKIEDLKIEYHVICNSLERIEKYIKQDVQDKKIVREKIAKIKSDILTLTTRVESLEKQVAV